MTWHHDPDRIGAIRKTNCPHRLGPGDFLGKLSIRNGAAARDAPEFIPDATLKWCARRLHRYVVYRCYVTREVTIDLIPQAMRIAGRFELEPIFSIVQPQQTQHAFFVIGPVKRAQLSGPVCHKQQFADGRIYPIDKQI
jgi:hypothetical protein